MARSTPRGLAQIIRAEACVLPVYLDEGVPCNGMGHNDPKLPLDLVISVDQAVEQFLQDMVRFDRVVTETATRIYLPNEHDGLSSRAFNRGVRGYREHEAALIAAANARDTRKVALELVGDANTGRRIREAGIYANGDYRDLQTISGKRYDTPMMLVYHEDPYKPNAEREWQPIPMDWLRNYYETGVTTKP